MGFQIFNFEDNSNVSVVSRKGIFKVIQYDKDFLQIISEKQDKSVEKIVKKLCI